MRKKIIYGIVTCILFSLTVLTFKPSVAQEEAKPSQEEAKPSQEEAKPSQEEAKPSQEEAKPSQEEAKPSEAKEKAQLVIDTYQGSTVTISGKVIFTGYKEGQQIKINVKSSSVGDPPDIASIEIPQPGEYSLKVPQNIGDVYINAVVLEPGQIATSKDSLSRTYSKNPLKVSLSDIKDIDIIITTPPPLLMDTYQGSTVTISGKVIFTGYKEGQRIKINVKSSSVGGPPDIASVEIPQPGEYSLKVPQDTGDVYISAVVLESGERGPHEDSLRRRYGGGQPIKVKTSDISGINIMF